MICIAATAVAGDSSKRTDHITNPRGDAVSKTNLSNASASSPQSNVPCIPLATAYKCPAWVSTFDGVGNDGDTPGDNYLNSHVAATSPDGRSLYIGGGTTNKSTGVDFLAVAFDTASGAQRWSFEFPGLSAGLYALAYAIAVSPNNDRVYLTGTSDITGLTTIALSTATGELLWIANKRVYDGPSDISVSADGQRVFICGLGGFSDPDGSGHAKGVTLAYDAATGTQLWSQHDTGSPGLDTIAYKIVSNRDSNRVYVAAGALNVDGYTTDLLLLTYDAATGNLLNEAHHPTFGLLPAGLAISPDGSHVFLVEANIETGTNTAFTIAYDAGGQEVWSARSPGPCVSGTNCSARPWYFAPVTVSPDSNTAFTATRFSGDGHTGLATIAYDVAAGAQKWIAHYDADINSGGGPVVVANPNGAEVYIAGPTISGAVTLGYDAATGEQKWASLYPRGGANGIAVTPDGSKVFTVGNIPGYLVHPPNTTNPADPADVFAIAFDTATAPTPPSALQVTDVVSRKTHGGAGDFDIHFSNNGNGHAGIEPRSGGTNGEHTIIFTFSSPLLIVGGASVDCGSISSSTLGPGANQYTVNLTGQTACDGQYISVTLTDVIATDGTASTAMLSPPIGLLLGDTNANAVVSNTDVSNVKAQVAAPVTVSNFRDDVTANGVISNTDVALAKSRTGSALP
jgi:hypothetical protein